MAKKNRKKKTASNGVRSGKKKSARKARAPKSASAKRKTPTLRGAAKSTRTGNSVGRTAGKAKAKPRAALTSADAPLIGGVGDEAVKKATGRGWAEWIALLDAAGAPGMSHQEIAIYLNEQCGVGDWWSQMVTVGYEQAKGRRDEHQKPSGYEISVSKTLGVPIARAFAAWEDAAIRGKWLADPAFSLRSITPNKYIRFQWIDGNSKVNLNFQPRGGGKSQVSVQHGKLPDAGTAERMKAYWAEQLNRLTSFFGM